LYDIIKDCIVRIQSFLGTLATNIVIAAITAENAIVTAKADYNNNGNDYPYPLNAALISAAVTATVVVAVAIVKTHNKTSNNIFNYILF